MADKFLDIQKTDETQQSTPEENYFSRSKNQWILVSDMSDMHVRRAFKRLLRMIRLGQLVEIDDIHKDTFNKLEVRNEIENIEAHCQKVKEKLET
jgi:hypothetical protein|tara:strand:- start:991 stop:1275 length:285 start_codon:yes stop_codon:yes gene_type:complete